MFRERVESNALDAVGFDPDLNVLELEWKGGAVYRYFTVPRRLYESLRAAESMGAFVNREIVPRFRSERVA